MKAMRAIPLALLLALLVAPLVTVPTPATAQSAADRARVLPADEVLRLLEEASGIESAGKSSLAGLSDRPLRVQADSLHSYDALHYRLDITPSRTSRHVDGTVTLTLVVRDPAFTTVDLDAIAMTFSSVKVNGDARTTWTTGAGKLNVPVCEGPSCPPHAPGDTLVVEVAYACNPTTGFYYYPRNSYTLSEPYDARYWWPCYDEPSDKTRLDVYATVPLTESCWSNGLLIGIAPGGPGTHVWHWQETHPIATYLVSVAAANFWRFDQLAGTVPIVHVAFPEDSTRAKLDFVNVPAMLTTFSNLWEPYPFDKYGQATVDPFGAGGMEHQTMTTLRRQLLRGDRLYEYVWAHELAHQWWGDWVTCVDFRDIWLNEGFATYGEALFVGSFYSPAAYDSAIAAHMASALTADANFRYAIYDPPANYLFGTTIYKKGGSVLHMLRRVLGDTDFFAGLRLYGQRFAYGNATTRELQLAMEDASGEALAWFFDQWIFAAGIPTYSWAWQAVPADPPAPDESDVALFVRQVQTAAPLYRMPIEFRVTRAARPDTFVTVWNDAVSEQAFVVRVNGTVTGVMIDPRGSILKRVQPYVLDAGDPAVALDPGPGRIELSAAPNPARGNVVLRGAWLDGTAAATMPATARFAVFDAGGRLVRDLGAVAAPWGASAFDVMWDRRDDAGQVVAPGIYFVQVVAGPRREARPLVLVR